MGYVYLMESAGRYKIGKADNVERRLATFQTADPQIRVVHVIPTRDAYGLEAYLHERFAGQRIWADREWFQLRPEDVQAIQALCGGFRYRRPGRRLRISWRRLWRECLWLCRWLPLTMVALAYTQPHLVRSLRLPRLTSGQQVMVWILLWVALVFNMRDLLRKVQRRWK